MAAGISRGQVSLQLFQALAAGDHALFQTPHIRLAAGKVRGEVGLGPPQLQKLPGKALGIGRQGGELLLKLAKLPALFRKLGVNLLNAALGLVHLGGDAAAAVLLAPQFLLNPGEVFLIVFHISPEHGHLAVQLLVGAGEHIRLQADGFQLLVPLPQFPGQILRLTVEAVQIIMGLLKDEGGGGVVLFRLLGGGGELIQGLQPYGHLHALELILELQVLFGLFRLLLEGLDLHFQFGDLVPDAQQIFLRLLELTLGLLLAVAVFGNARRFLENLPAVAAFQGQNLVNAALADVAVTLPAQARIHEQLVDVPQPGGLLVDVVFAVPGAVVAPGDHHLVGVVQKGPVGVVQGQGGLGKAHGGALLGAAEDHVLHLRAPEGLGALLSHDP